MRSSVAEQFLAFLSQKTTGDGDAVIALLEDEPAGDGTNSPFVVVRTALAAISGSAGANAYTNSAIDQAYRAAQEIEST